MSAATGANPALTLGLAGIEQEFAAQPDHDQVRGRDELDAIVELDLAAAAAAAEAAEAVAPGCGA